MTVLVAIASKHKGTLGIGEAIAEELRVQSIDAEVRSISDIDGVGQYDAFVIGSAVYMGRWLPEATKFVRTHREAIISVPAWLFSSGPLGLERATSGQDLRGLPEMMALTGAIRHRVFSGQLNPADLKFAERLVAKAVHAPFGDFRDWPAIRSWARSIGSFLKSSRNETHSIAS